MTNYKNDIHAYLELEKSVLDQLDIDAINKAMNVLADARDRGSMIYTCGNGGSAATASHFQNDFNKGISEHCDKKFKFQCLNDNVSTMLAIANDISYDEIFRFQLDGRMNKDDVLLCISGSGNSENVLRAAQYAHSIGATVIGLTGFTGGKLLELSDVSLHVPISSMQITEDVHMIFDHLIMAIFYKTMAGLNHVKN